MDLVAFTDFVLAWDHRSQPAAIKYFFDIFDLEKQVGCGGGVGGGGGTRGAWQSAAWPALVAG